MSNWTEIRDQVSNVLGVAEVTEEVKETLTKNLIEKVLPEVEKLADNFVAQTQEQAKNESGWTKMRDAVVLPLLINGAIKIATYVLSKCETKEM